MARGMREIGLGAVFVTIIIAAIALYLFSVFSGTTDIADIDVDISVINVFKIVVVGIAAFAAMALVKKATGTSLSKRDAFTIALIALLLWFLWDKVLASIFNAGSLDDIAAKTAMKLGFR